MGEQSEGAASKLPVGALGVILVLSLATWWFFYAQAMPLDGGATVIVVGIWAAVVLLSRWAWLHFRKGART